MQSRPRDWMAVRANRIAASTPNATERLRATLDGQGAIARADIDAVAAQTGLPLAAVAGAASYYADLRAAQPVRACEGTGCFVARHGVPAGAGDGEPVYCLGCCYAAPAVLVGQTPRADPARTPIPPIPYACAAPEAVVLAGLCGDDDAWESLESVLARRDRSELLAAVARSGLRGRGGAEFPVAAKWDAARRYSAPRYVVANGDEGDPGSFCDRLLMESDPDRVLAGLALCGYATGAVRGLILVRSEYPDAAAALRRAVESARAAGHLGRNIHGSGFDFEIGVHVGAGSYVAGEETALLRSLEGLRGTVQSRPPYPAEYGYRGRPSVVQNVETLAAVPWIARHGGEAYARLGLPTETGTKLVSLNSEFAAPGVYEVEFGTPLRAVVEGLGGGLRQGKRLRALQIGGPLGGFLGPDELDTPLAAADLDRWGVALGHGGLVAVPEGIALADLLRQLWTFAAGESCGSCAPCRVGTRRGLELVDRLDSSHPANRLYPRLLDTMETASMCAFGSGVATAVRSLLRVYAPTPTSEA